MQTSETDQYVPPSSFFHEMRGNTQSRTACDKRKCQLCLITCGICVGGFFLVRYLISQWDSLVNIS